MRFVSALAASTCLLLSGCDSNGMGTIAWNAFVDELRGAPSEKALQPSARFEHGGLAFDYPALLRLRSDAQSDGSPSWSLEYGQFELEVMAPRKTLGVSDYLGVLGMMFEGGRRIDADGPDAGATETLCGRERTSTRLRLKMFGEWSALEGFDLPAPAGESRLLVFSDELVAGKSTLLARTTRERVLGSLRCDPGLVEPAADREAHRDPSTDATGESDPATDPVPDPDPLPPV